MRSIPGSFWLGPTSFSIILMKFLIFSSLFSTLATFVLLLRLLLTLGLIELILFESVGEFFIGFILAVVALF